MLEEIMFYDALEAAGLPRDPTQVVGRPFLFGETVHVIAGTVTSIGWGAEGIVLYVSSPRFQGLTIRRLRHTDNSWCVETEDKSIRPKGTFKLM